MKKIYFLFIAFLLVSLIFILSGVANTAQKPVEPAPNGIAIPADYKDWRILAPSSRSDNNTIRVVLGNDIAIQAARDGKTNPWQDGTMFAKLVWKSKVLEKWQSAIVPGDFVHVEFMIKDSKKYAATGGWGFARWVGMDLKPYGDDADFVMECFGCHTPMKKNDYVFTAPAVMP